MEWDFGLDFVGKSAPVEPKDVVDHRRIHFGVVRFSYNQFYSLNCTSPNFHFHFIAIFEQIFDNPRTLSALKYRQISLATVLSKHRNNRKPEFEPVCKTKPFFL